MRIERKKQMIEKESNYGELYPLSNPQKRIWYTEKLNTGLPINNIGGATIYQGTVNFELLEEAFHIYLKHNEVLRARLHEDNGEAYQYIAEYDNERIPFFDFSQEVDPDIAMRNWADKQMAQVFEIYHKKLYYIAIFKLSDKRGGWLGNLSHFVADGWSINMFMEEVAQIYLNLINHEEIKVVRHSYMDYLELEKKYLESDRFIKNKIFWNNMFENLPEPIKTKNYKQKPGYHLFQGRRKVYDLSHELSKSIKIFSKKNNISINTVFVSVLLLYLYKYYDKTDLVVGNPTFNRSGKKEKSIFGMLTSTMAFRYYVNEDESVIEMVKDVGRCLMKCLFNQRYPYNYLTQDLELSKRGCKTLMDFYVNYYNTKNEGNITDLPLEIYEGYNGYQLYQFGMIVKEWNDGNNFTLCFDYRLIDFNDVDIENMYQYMNCLFEQLLENPDKKVKNMSIITADEEKKIMNKFFDTSVAYPKNKTIEQLFEEQVNKTPNKIAIRYKESTLTYFALNERVNKLARYMVDKGLKPNEVVVLYVSHSIEAVIGILAVIKAGGTYLPINPESPVERIEYILNDSAAQIMLVNSKLPSTLNYSCTVLNLNDEELYCGNGENLNIYNSPDDLVYIIYTSGSTGKPKGVMIKHRGLVNYICWARKVYVKSDDEIFALYSSFAFDLTVTSIFTPLISGSSIEVYRDDQDEYVLYQIMREKKATIVKCTPAHLSLMKELNNRNSSIRRLIVGGENLRTDVARSIYESFQGNIEIYNEYGPTETVVGCMIYQFDYDMDADTSVPIGIPADNVQIYLLDENLSQVSINTPGEIYIAGDSVGHGYLNREDMTNAHFLENPFNKQTTMYKSGDVAKIKYDGNMEYIGRKDHQVKIRGYRIELGEIERNLVHFDEINEAVVVKKEDAYGNEYLCAYLVENAHIPESNIRDYLKMKLPSYMIPSFFVKLDNIPLTHNGKINVELLPEPEKNHAEENASPENEWEEELKNILEETLHVESISMGDNFFNLGGDSIKAIQVSSKLRDKGYLLKVKQILSYSTIKDMASVMQKSEVEEDINDDKTDSHILNTPITSWLFEKNLSNLNYYNQSVLLKMKDDIEVDMVEYALDELIKYHDVLRLNYKIDTKELYYNNKHLQEESKIEVYDLSEFHDAEQIKKISKLGEELKGSFNIENGILIKGAMFKLNDTSKLLLLTAHHLIVDGVSFRILIEDLYTIIDQKKNGISITLPKKSHSFKKWSEQINQFGAELFNKEIDYWNRCIKSDFTYKCDFDLGEDLVSYSKTIVRSLDSQLTNDLLFEAGKVYHIDAKEIMILSLAQTVKEITGESEVLLELEGHGREDLFENMDWNRTVGWFTSIYPVLLKINEMDLSKQIVEVKEQLRKIPTNGIGFGILKYICKSLNDKDRKQIRFNYLGDFNEKTYQNDIFTISDMDTGLETSKANSLSALMDINAIIINNKLKIMLTYSSQKFKDESIHLFIDKFISAIENTIKHCCEKKDIELTPSDFASIDLSQEELDSLFL